MDFNLENFKQQRHIRQKRRNQLLIRFQIAMQRVNSQFRKSPTHQHHQNASQLDAQYQQLIKQNKFLKSQLEQVESKSSEKIKSMNEQIANVKSKYLNQMEEITKLSRKEKNNNDKKVKALFDQIKNTSLKNQQIQNTNKMLKDQANQSQKLYEQCLKDIQIEYITKIKQFEGIMLESKQKIDVMEKGLNEQQIVNNALKNNKLIEALLNNSNVDMQSLGSIQKFENILQNKKQVIANLIQNSRMKQSEIKKIKQLTEKFKNVFQSINKQKKQLLQQNSKMTSQLIEIKKIFSAALGQPQEDDDDDNQEAQQNQQKEQDQIQKQQ